MHAPKALDVLRHRAGVEVVVQRRKRKSTIDAGGDDMDEFAAALERLKAKKGRAGGAIGFRSRRLDPGSAERLVASIVGVVFIILIRLRLVF